jgi:hypothetical protein
MASQENEPKPVKNVMPAYPDVLKRMGISGTVRVRVTITPDGSVKDIEGRGGARFLPKRSPKPSRNGAIRQATGREFLTSR